MELQVELQASGAGRKRAGIFAAGLLLLLIVAAVVMGQPGPPPPTSGSSGVTSFNTRTGAVTFATSDLPAAIQPLSTNNGSTLTNLNASELRSGTVPSARLSLAASDIPTLTLSKISDAGTAGYSNANAFALSSTTNVLAKTNDTRSLLLTNAANIFGGSGAGLTGIPVTGVTGISVFSSNVYQTGTFLQAISTGSESNLVSFTIPGGAMGANSSINIIIGGELLNNTGATANFTNTFYFGGTTMISYADGVSTAVSRQPFYYLVTLVNTNTTTGQVLNGTLRRGNGTAAAGSTGDVNNGSTAYMVNNTASIDTSTNNTFIWSIKMATNSANAWVKVGHVTAVLNQ